MSCMQEYQEESSQRPLLMLDRPVNQCLQFNILVKDVMRSVG